MSKLVNVLELEVEGTRFAALPQALKVVILALTAFCIGLAVFFLFGFTIQGKLLIEYTYYWLCLAIFYFCIFILLPARKKDLTVPWYDYLAAFGAAGLCLYGTYHAWDIALQGWYNVPMGVAIMVLMFEASRRGGGNIYFIVSVILSAYPLYASYMPGIFWGIPHDFEITIRKLAFSDSGLVGLITKVMTFYLIGFLVFAGALLASGGGDFFLKLASSLVGRFRGGPAKIAVLASGFFGSMSGSIVSNIAATGSFTIPSMKKLGYPLTMPGL